MQTRLKRFFSTVRSIFRGFRLLFLTGVFISTLIAALGWYFSPALFWPGALFALGLVFGYVIATSIFLRYALTGKKWPAACWAVVVFAGGVPLFNSVTLPVSTSEFSITRKPETLRIMQWNCGSLPASLKRGFDNKIYRKAAEQFIQQMQPDLICVQDYADIRGRYNHSNHNFFEDSLGYRYSNIDWHFQELFPYGVVRNGTAIYAKIPLIASGVVPFTNRQYPEAIVWADVLLNQKRLRIITVHFRSMNLNGHNAYKRFPFNQFVHQDSAIIMSRNILNKLLYYQQEHGYQAEVLRSFIDTCRYPVVLAADLNTVPAQHTYRLVRGTLRDDFFGHTAGFGATFNYLAPNIRIDYLMSSRLLRCLQWYHHKEGFFDHDPLVADYEFPAL